MRTPPGFTAESSLRRAGRQYRTTTRGAPPPRGATVLPQQSDIEAPGTCCGVHCIGPCACFHGRGHCIESSAVERGRLPRLLPAGGRVSMAIDACHADRPVNGAQAFAACPCGCWATTHDAGCFPCHHHHATTPPVVLKA